MWYNSCFLLWWNLASAYTHKLKLIMQCHHILPLQSWLCVASHMRCLIKFHPECHQWCTGAHWAAADYWLFVLLVDTVASAVVGGFTSWAIWLACATGIGRGILKAVAVAAAVAWSICWGEKLPPAALVMFWSRPGGVKFWKGAATLYWACCVGWWKGYDIISYCCCGCTTPPHPLKYG